VRLVIFDADHRVSALGNRLGQPEQIGAGVIERVAAIAVVLERVVDQLVERLPTGARFHGDHRGAECDCLFYRRRRRFLDEYGGRGTEPRGRRLRTGVSAADLLGDPADCLRIGHTEQEEQVGRSRADGQAEPDVVAVDERDRSNRHVQATGCFDQGHHRAVQREQQLTKGKALALRHQPSFVRFDYKSPTALSD
jgi:hypothetical protein